MEVRVTDPTGAYTVRPTKSRMALATIEDTGKLCKGQTMVAYCGAGPVDIRCRPWIVQFVVPPVPDSYTRSVFHFVKVPHWWPSPP